MSKRDYLLQQLNDQIDRFDTESKLHKQMYRRSRYTVFTLAAASTALASLGLAFPALQSPTNLAIVVLTTAVGVVTSIEGLRKPGELWIHERTTFYALQDLKRELEYRFAAEDELVPVDDMFARMQSILGASGDKWNRQIVGRQAHDVQPSAGGDGT